MMTIKIAGGKTENGIVVGNNYDKYASKNPIVRRMMKGFENSLSGFVATVSPKTIHEVGCGEGYWVLKWNKEGIDARGCDFSQQVINIAQENSNYAQVQPSLFKTRSIYDLNKSEDSADLIVCCEVLEHLEDPEAGLKAIKRVAENYVILSVPREPIWRALNLARGKYVTDLGNTPGHLQHWSKKSFIKLVEKHFIIVEVKNPLPWTMILCRQR
ncbi:class I SAM-dependent methyltransferase [Rahnella contaminans]|jgi:2-polyprenyl-3-methyl-5-hydroxy-6-metoxy-1,4-benzoquinol methylase|uniref:class I SAM-dependent methyltransferase n=1 Tax=Rahnella contaminans TaxID=2703882 RepID=UPI001F2E2E7C|nr:class I SAM-dependent methyltransferase [Rahnella contaminans]